MRILGLGDRYYVECSCRFFFKFGQLHYGLGKKVEVEVENVVRFEACDCCINSSLSIGGWWCEGSSLAGSSGFLHGMELQKIPRHDVDCFTIRLKSPVN